MRKKLQQLRQEALAAIRALFARYNLEIIYASDLDAGSSPVVRVDPVDADLSFTLDRVSVYGNLVFIDASSCFDNLCLKDDEIGTDLLVDIVEWLEEHEDVLKESVEDDDQEEA